MATLSVGGRTAIRQLIDDLVGRRYDAIAADGRIGRLTPEELDRAVADYPGTLIALPAEALDDVDIYPRIGIPGRAKVDVDLWTAEEGKSDLTLSLTLEEGPEGVTISIEDLHVL